VIFCSAFKVEILFLLTDASVWKLIVDESMHKNQPILNGGKLTGDMSKYFNNFSQGLG
jgi:hypothetical protein